MKKFSISDLKLLLKKTTICSYKASNTGHTPCHSVRLKVIAATNSFANFRKQDGLSVIAG